jgi:hypothetical protein
MRSKTLRSRSCQGLIRLQNLALCCTFLLLARPGVLRAQDKVPPADTTKADTTTAKLPPEQLEALVAPIALYPDDLLAQTLVASTYPLEVVQLQQWLAKHPSLKDKALADSVAKQPWDPSIQSMAAVPEVVKRLSDDIQWATDLGNAFLAQQKDVMDAVQRMRAKAKANGALASNEKQKVDTQVVEQKTVIVVQSTDPEVVYVPSYSPTVVYGPPVYPYPPIYYPPYYPGTAFVSFSFGVMMGAAMWGGSCCHAGWGGGGNNVYINNNNNFNKVNHYSGGRGNNNNNWQHNPSHRGGAPYGDRGTAGKYGGSTRPSAGTQPSNRGGGAGGPSASNRAGTGAGSPSASNRAGTGAGAGTGRDQVGSRDVSRGSGSGNSGFGGGSSGYSGASARSSSSRGASSMGSRGGGSRGGGGARRR